MLPRLHSCLGAALLRNQCPAPSSCAGAAATLVACCQSDVLAAGAQYWQRPGFSCTAAASSRGSDVASITCSIPAAELQHAKGCTCAGCGSQAASSLLRLRALRASMQIAGRQLTTSATDMRVCTASCRCERCRAVVRRFSSATADGRQLTTLPSSTCICTSTCRGERCRPLVRRFSSATVDEMAREIDRINELFVAAREEIDFAQEDAETTYFNESVDTAKGAVAEAFDAYEAVLNKLAESERAKLQRAMGLKMEQLKAELAQLDQLHA